MYVPSNSPKYICQGCRNKIPTDDLESIFHEELKRFFFSPEEIAHHLEEADGEIKNKATLLEAMEWERTKLRAAIDKLYELYQSNMIDKHGFGAKYGPLAARQAQFEDEIPVLQAELDVLRISHLSQEEVVSGARDLYTRWPTLPEEERRQIVETIVERIVIGQGDVEITLYYAPPVPSSREPGAASGNGGSPPPSPQTHGNRATEAHGFIAAISWKRAGNVAWRAARDIVMRPVSSGSRSAPSAARGSSGISSRNSTPA